MSHRSLFAAALACMILLPLMRASAADNAPTRPAKDAPGKDVFGLTRVWQIHLEIPAKEYEAMQPPGGMGFPGFGFPGQPPKQPAKKDGARDSDRSVFGTEFPWVRGTFTADGKSVENVGFRYKGNSTYMSTARNLKRSIKVEFDHFNDAQHFHGLKTLNLHCGVMDSTKGRESLAYSVLRAAGVPAPRTALAEVRLTVPGKYDKELMGVYTIVEQVDKTFLKDRFRTAKGLVMKPERIRGLDYLGDDWERYKPSYQPKGEATQEQAERVIAFTKLVNRADDEEFRKEIASYLDVDAFLRFMAANALIVNLDSFFTLGHNYYLYLHPESNKFVFIPWDVDLSMANFGMWGSADQIMDLSLTSPYPVNGSRLTDRLLAMKNVSEKYQQVLKDMAAKCFTKEQLLPQVEAIEKATAELIARETKAVAARKEGAGGFGFGGPAGGGMFGQNSPNLRTFVEKRTASVEAQLAGKSKGYVPAMGFGMPGGGGGAFGPANALAKPLLDAIDADKDGKLTEAEFESGMKKLFREWDRDQSGVLDQRKIAEGLQRLLPAPKGGPPGFFPPGKEPPKRP